MMRLPHDKRLPGFRTLLDPDRFAAAAAAVLPPAAVAVESRPLYVRYKPGTNAVVVWVIRLAGRGDPLLVHGKCLEPGAYSTARDKAAAGRFVDPDEGHPFGCLDAESLLFFRFPNDPDLPGLRFATHPKRMQRAIYAHVPAWDPRIWRVSDRRLVLTPIRFKPGRRALLRADTRAVRLENGEKVPLRIFVRVGDEDGRIARLAAWIHGELESTGDVAAPEVLAHLPEPGLTLVADAGGVPFPGLSETAAPAGRVLARLHAVQAPGVAPRGPAEALAEAADALAMVGRVAPELEKDTTALLAALESAGRRTGSGRITLVHGDFHPEQILDAGDRTMVLDFDRSHAGDPVEDLGNFSAYLMQAAATGGVPPDRDGVERLLAAYRSAAGPDPEPAHLAFWTAVGLAKLAPGPFRRLAPGWDEATARILQLAREVTP
jgi:hypothetical protein